jgi:hypothetical protein
MLEGFGSLYFGGSHNDQIPRRDWVVLAGMRTGEGSRWVYGSVKAEPEKQHHHKDDQQ